MKVGDFVEWGDQSNYPGLCGIVTETGGPVGIACASPEIFVHWLNFPKDYDVGGGWEKIKDIRLLSAGETQ